MAAMLLLVTAQPAFSIPRVVVFQWFRMHGRATCQNVGTVSCSSFSGNGTSKFFGNTAFQFTTLVNVSGAFSNGSNGFCYPASGYGSISGIIMNTRISVPVSQVGLLCDVGATGGPQIFRGTYSAFGYGKGSGRLTWSDDRAGTILLNAVGNAGQS